jgi:serine/threonine-protein kinase
MMKRSIAVKLIRAIGGVDLDDEVAGRFMREAKNTARVQHKNIIEVFDLGRTNDGGLYFVMELLEGESLSDRIRGQGTLSPEETVHIGRQICEALHVAHTAGVIHRDLKPANVMLLSRAGDDDYVKVLDFGVAKSYSPDQQTQLTHTGMLVGTVDYMAPEQIMGKPVDGRTDIYSLGVVLYKMLCGKAPFRDTGVPALIHAHLNLMPKPLIELSSAIPNELDRVVLRCLMKSPDRRYESMAEVSRALADAIDRDEPVAAPPYARGGRDPRAADPYAVEDVMTTVSRVGDPRAPPPRPSAPPEAPAPEDAVFFEDATRKMDRTLGFKKPTQTRSALPMTPRGLERRGQRSAPPTASHDVARASAEPRTCAMCQTVNAPHVAACLACGVSLAPGDQEAVHARVRAVTRQSSNPPPLMPGSTPYTLGAQITTGPHLPIPRPTHTATGPQLPPPHLRPPPWLPQHEPPPRSIWERFLMWTGLRGR